MIPVYEAGEDEGLLFISMRLVDGVDLEQLLANTGPLEPLRAARLITQVAAALDAAHARGLVHRDVKPANVLLTTDEPEHAYLTDFGVSKRVGVSRLTNAGQWVGTLDYLSPEQIRGEEVGPAADTYMLAGLLYHCLTGSRRSCGTARRRRCGPTSARRYPLPAPPVPSCRRGSTR